jgi:hypothetical protein
MPVVTPTAASIDTVNAVLNTLPLLGTICSRPRRWQCSSVRVRQIRPRASRAMKLMASACNNRRPAAGRLRFPVFVIDQQDHFAEAIIFEDFFDAVKGHAGLSVG